MRTLPRPTGPTNLWRGNCDSADTLKAVRDEFSAKGIRLGSLQLDSWWYPKGPDDSWSSHNGIWTYTASPALFTPDLAQYLKSSGVATYEQDWLGQNAQTAFNLTDPDAFLGNMAAAMAQQGLTVQYCMALPEHFLQSSKYSNVTTIRVSQDRFRSDVWTNFFYSSRLATSLGVWPYSDVFMSTETNNLIAATISAGPVGVGDPLGGLSKENLLRTVRSDGVIVKPDVSATPRDDIFIQDAAGVDTPMVASASSDFGGGLTAHYIFAYPRGANQTVTIAPAAFGIAGKAYFFDYQAGNGRLIDAQTTYTFDLASGPGYFVLMPIAGSGIAFLGDRGHFVTLGKARIPSVAEIEGQTAGIDATVSFAAGEQARTLFGYSPQPVTVKSLEGRVSGSAWDSTTQIFTVHVHPEAGTDGAHVRIFPASTAPTD